VVSGYSGGTMENPSYRQVCTSRTGRGDRSFDQDVVTYDQLLEVFWAMHDPTQMDRRGPDVGTQYRA
jgi:peptide-methionine (S)-S-oxide reductase